MERKKDKKKIRFLLLGLLLPIIAAGIGVGIVLSKGQEPFVNDIKPVRQYEYEAINVTKREENHILDAAVLGLWIDARVDGGSFGPGRSYDNKRASRWNPSACADYVGDPAIVYLLDGYYDMDAWEMLFTVREIFFDMYVSKDGRDFRLVREVNRDNYQEVYTTDGDKLVCMLDGLDAKDIAFVKILFTGSNHEKNTAWISLNSVRCIGRRLGDGPDEMPEFDDPYKIKPMDVRKYTLIGTWMNDQTKTSEVAPEKSYDGNIYSPWNPGAKGRFEGEPGIIYMLTNPEDIKKIQLYFGKYKHYFDISVSQDGTVYSPVAKISFANEEQAYTVDKNKAYVCTLDGLSLQGIRYIKIVFTGREDGGNWAVLNEVVLNETGAAGIDTSWMMRTEPISKHPWIESAQLIGKWKDNADKRIQWARYKSYDEDWETFWNPEAEGKYAGEPGVVYTLRKGMALNKLQLTFGKDIHYFDVYTSQDGKNYTQIAAISPANSSKAYVAGTGDTYVCTLEGLGLKDVKTVKLIFTGRKSNSTWVALQEISVSEAGAAGVDTSWMMGTEIVSNHPWIKSATAVGSWKNERKGEANWGLAQTIDEDRASFWNPEAQAKYAGEPGVVYTLRKGMALNKLQLYFKNNDFYFNVYTSQDGTNYTQIAAISPANESKAYEDASDGGHICTLDGLALKDITAIKLIFTGRKNNSTWVALQEIDVSEAGATGVDTSWMMGTEIVSSHPWIKSATAAGSWKNERKDDVNWGIARTIDQDVTTFWNPEAQAGYAGEPGVVYTLKKSMTLNKVQLHFKNDVYYFNVYTSQDGESYTQIAAISPANESKAYEDASDGGHICTLDGMALKDVAAIRLIFTGRKNNSTWVALQEINVSEGGAAEADTSWMLPDDPDPGTEEPNKGTAAIETAKPIGAWSNSQEGTSYSVMESYDDNTATFWNPGTKATYQGEPGVVYTLNGKYNITGLKMTFAVRYFYFQAAVSEDGITYTQIADVTAENYAAYYKDGYICTVDQLKAERVKYIRIVFTGDSEGKGWVSFNEFCVIGTAAEGGEDPSAEVPITITDAALSAEWTTYNAANLSKTYDGSIATTWDPAAKTADYNSGESVTYTLDRIYELTTVRLTSKLRLLWVEIYTSPDGESWKAQPVCSVANETRSYWINDGDYRVCTFTGLSEANVGYVRIDFKGNNTNTAAFSLCEVELFGKVDATAGGDDPAETAVKAVIAGSAPIGTWKLDRIGSASVGPERSYDSDVTGTCWNPQTVDTTYTSGEGIVYTLDRAYDLTDLSFVFNRKHYFQIAVSEDGTNYTALASVDKDNASGLYSAASASPARVRCDLHVSTKDVKYIKLLFAGNEANNDFVGLFDVAVFGSVQ